MSRDERRTPGNVTGLGHNPIYSDLLGHARDDTPSKGGRLGVALCGRAGQGARVVVTRSPVDEVLRRAAEIARNGPYRWARGKSTQLILRAHTKDLHNALVTDPELRSKLRASFQRSGRSVNPRDAQTVDDPEKFRARLARCVDQDRMLAAGLIHDDARVAAAALHLVHSPEDLPERQETGDSQEGSVADAAPADVDDERATESESESLEEPIPAADPDPAGVADVEAALAAMTAERDEQASKVAELERVLEKANAELDELKQSLPSNRQVRRQRRKLKNAERTLNKVAELQDQVEELEGKVGQLESELAETRDERDEVEANLRAEVREHLRVRQTLERRLQDTPSRAQYLVTAVTNEIADLERQMEGLGHGRTRTRTNKRLVALRRLNDDLRMLYTLQMEEPDEEAAQRSQPAQVRDLAVSVTPLGGGTEIGGSAVLVEGGGLRVLVDAGLRPQGETTADTKPADIDQLGDRRLDSIIVTHAHTDHSGYVPAVVDRFPNVPVFCTPGTAALLPTMWEDSRQVMRRRLEAESRWMEGTAPLYSEAEIQWAEDRIRPVDFNRMKRLNSDTGFELFPAGHIVGAAGVVLTFGDRKVVITGDISDQEQATVGRMNLPGSATGADLLVIETTYCDQLHHKDRPGQVDDLVKAITGVYDIGGRILIPAFGLGRAQEVALILREHLPEVPVLIDGMAGRVSQIFERHAQEEGRELSIIGGNVQRVENRQDRQRLLRTFSAGVIISTSGMMAGGPVMTWALDVLPDSSGALFLCGYQDEESPGRKLQQLARDARRGNTPSFPLQDQERLVHVEVRAQVSTYSLSAHADRAGLLSIAKQTRPAATMLVHGEPRPQRRFARVLDEASFDTVPTSRWERP